MLSLLAAMLLTEVNAQGEGTKQANQVRSPNLVPLQILDVAMDAGGKLRGILRDETGNPSPDTQVLVLRENQEIASSITDADGHFAIGGLRGGVYSIEAGAEGVPVRAWAQGTAPPSAQPTVQIFRRDSVRGQFTPYGLPMYNPWAVTAAAGLTGALAVGLYSIDSGS